MLKMREAGKILPEPLDIRPDFGIINTIRLACEPVRKSIYHSMEEK